MKFMQRYQSGGIGGKVVLAIAVLAFSYGVWWLTQSYQPEPVALKSAKTVLNVRETANGYVLTPKTVGNGQGIIFIPGGKVAPLAYAYKLSGLVQSGYTVIVTNPAFNLAVLDLRSTGSFFGEIGSVSVWYTAGHSLGGVKACQYASESPKIQGVMLLASYCDKPIKQPILSIAGANDPLASPSEIKSHADTMPTATYTVIPEATHAQFGNYGIQGGDARQTLDDSSMYRTLTRTMLNWLSKQTPN